MKFVFYTNSISPHQLPLANELVSLLGEENYRYIYRDELSAERKDLGWENKISDVWCKHGDDNAVRLENPEILMSGIRALDVFESRAKENKKTFYCSERWFKPTIGFLRVFVPSYFKMARRIVKLLNESEDFYYLPMGIHAARDMARLCGFMNGDWKCLFRAPKLDFERKPGGRIWISGESRNTQNTRKYCLDKMRMWGYFVESGNGERGMGNGGEEVKVLWVGRLLKLKRVDTIIKAVGECSKSKKITLDIYGFGPEEAKLKELAAKYGDVIKFYPPVPIREVRKLMREHDVYVLSSNAYEGWGAVVSEALEEEMAVLGTYEAGSSATILPEGNLFCAGDWRRLKKIFLNDILQINIGLWTAKGASTALIEDIKSVRNKIFAINKIGEKKMINVGIIGCGFVGGALKTWLEENNKDVKIFVSDPAKGYNDDLSQIDIAFLQIHVPTEDDGTQDLTLTKELIRKLPNVPVFIRTTILPGTSEMLSNETGHDVYFMPEFLTERTHIEDFKKQTMVFTGALDLLVKVFPGKKFTVMSSLEAELTKYIHNVFGAYKVTYFNAAKEYVEKMGGDWAKVHTGTLLSGYINDTHTYVPGPDGKLGYGGKCFPKDVNAFAKMTQGTSMGTLLAPLHELNVHFRGVEERI